MKQETIDRIRKFVSDRDWNQFHTPSNMAKSIAIEAAELLECFQWSDTEYDLQHVKEELADVIVYCQDMLDKLDPDKPALYYSNLAVTDKDLNYHVLTLFPEMIREAMGHSILGRAQEDGKIELETVNIRDFSHNKHHINSIAYLKVVFETYLFYIILSFLYIRNKKIY